MNLAEKQFVYISSQFVRIKTLISPPPHSSDTAPPPRQQLKVLQKVSFMYSKHMQMDVLKF